MNYGLMKVFYPETNIECADEKCTRFIKFMDTCYIDTQESPAYYCESCGQCLRYERKMAEKRKKNNGD